MTGTLKARGKALTKRAVRVQERVHGTKQWHTLAAGHTNTKGRITTKPTKLTKSIDVRLQYAGSAVETSTTSPVVAVNAAQVVQITSVSDLHPTAGDIVTLSGSAYPGITNRRAYLQELIGATWTSMATTTVPTDGTFTITTRSMQAGEQQYRVLVRGTAGVADAISAAQTFEVYAWYRLADLTPLAATSFASGPLTIGGSVYEDALGVQLATYQSVFTQYSLNYQCRLLRTTLGPTADSSPDFVGRYIAAVDDATPIVLDVAAGSSQSETAEISGGSVLRLTSFAVSGSGDAAWGNPEVLCLGRP